jgi:hypothetical protein
LEIGPLRLTPIASCGGHSEAGIQHLLHPSHGDLNLLRKKDCFDSVWGNGSDFACSTNQHGAGIAVGA